MEKGENNSFSLRFITSSPRQTMKLGRRLGEILKAGDVVALEGELGSGKTLFASGVARGVGVPADDPVVSPSFTIMFKYNGSCPLYHFDFYRLRAEDAFDTGLEDVLGRSGITVIEWADRVRNILPPDLIRVVLSYAGEGKRLVEIEFVGDRYTEVFHRFKEKVRKKEERPVR